MSVMALLSRLLLCFALVLNGVATAAASVHGMAASAAIPAAATAVVGENHCHDEATPATAAMMHAGHADHGEKHGAPATPDCCKSELCRCTCVPSIAATVPMQLPAGGVFAGHVVATALVHGHVSPVLSDPVRPPIG